MSLVSHRRWTRRAAIDLLHAAEGSEVNNLFLMYPCRTVRRELMHGKHGSIDHSERLGGIGLTRHLRRRGSRPEKAVRRVHAIFALSEILLTFGWTSAFCVAGAAAGSRLPRQAPPREHAADAAGGSAARAAALLGGGLRARFAAASTAARA